MYNFLLALHNITRWVVVILVVAALVRSLRGWFGGTAWSSTDRRLALFSTISIDIQFLLGLILYVFTQLELLSNFGAAMSDANVRRFAVEHPFYGLVILILAHIGSSRARKAETDKLKHRSLAIFFGIAALLVIVMIPWDRALLPGL